MAEKLLSYLNTPQVHSLDDIYEFASFGDWPLAPEPLQSTNLLPQLPINTIRFGTDNFSLE